MNKFIKFSVIIFIIGSLILLFGEREWFPDFYNPKFMGVIGLISVLVIAAPRFIFKNPKTSAEEQVRSPKKSLDFLQNAIAVSSLLNAAGGLGLFQLYKIGFEFDKMNHFAVQAILVFAVSNFCYHWYQMKFKKSLILAAMLIFLGGFVWEFFEFLSDAILGTQTMGHYGKFIIKDTVWDLIMNILGIITGAIISIKNFDIKRIGL